MIFRIFYFLLFFAFISSQNSQAQTPISSFQSNPNGSAGVITICQGQIITFTNTSTNVLSGSTYSWVFGTGSTPATANTVGPHVVQYNTATIATTVTLTVTNPNGQSNSTSKTVVVNASPVSNLLLANTGASFGTTTVNGITLFKRCVSQNTTSTNFLWNVSAIPGTTQTFNWGDASPNGTQSNIVAGQISHTYGLGAYTLTHTLTNAAGCQTVKQYYIFNGDAPTINVSGSGQTTCLPYPYEIDILSNNIPGTQYTVSFTDGTPSSVFSTINDTTIAHIFNTSSCGQSYPVGPIIINNAFSSTIVAQNACGTTFATVGPITISTGTDAQFTYSPASPICVNEDVSFSNTSSSGESVSNNGCSNAYGHYWSIQETTGYTVPFGTLGSNNGNINGNYDYTTWTNGTDSLVINFNVPGVYHVWMYTGNTCGMDSIMQLVTINPTGTVLATPLVQTICSGDFFNPIVFTSTVPGYTVTWNLDDTTNVTGFNLSTGSGITNTTVTPMMLTNTSNTVGVVELSAGVGCTNSAPTIVTINVNPVGNVQANPSQAYVCSGNNATIQLISNLQNATFTWQAVAPATITGESNGAGSTINQTLSNSGNTLDTVFYTIFVGGVQCPGDSIVVLVVVQPNLGINAVQDFTVCPGTIINPTDYITSPVGTTLTWTNTNAAIGIPTTGSGQIPTWSAGSNTGTTNITATITMTAVLNSICPSVQDQFTVTINPIGTVDLSTEDTLICSGQSVNISYTSNISNMSIVWNNISPTTITGASSGSANNGTVTDVLVNTGNTIDTVIYYFVPTGISCLADTVFLTVAVQPQITMNQVADITVCAGTSINPADYVTSPIGGVISWTNSNVNIGLAVSGNGQIPNWTAGLNNTGSSISGTITATAELNGCTGVQDEFVVTINPSPGFQFTTIPSGGLSCVSPTAQISGTIQPANCSVSWVGPGIVSGAQTTTITVNASGSYIVTITNPTTGCVNLDTVIMDAPNIVEITSVVLTNVLCYGGSDGAINLTTNQQGPLTYAWIPNVGSTNVLSNLSAGSYSVLITNDDQCSADTTWVITEPQPIEIDLVSSLISQCGEANGQLDVSVNGGTGSYTYSWSNGQNTQDLLAVDKGNYILTVTDANNCELIDTFAVDCTPLIPIVVPQFLSPNSDGKNDQWIFGNTAQYPEIQVWVYNRWGNIVYQSEVYQGDWNGWYTEGRQVDGPLPAATYFYVIDTKKKSQELIKGYLEIQP
jgi:gliding motility-associated-like protein